MSRADKTSVLLDTDQYAELRRRREAIGISIAEQLRRAVDAYLFLEKEKEAQDAKAPSH